MFYISISNGLLESGHRQKMGEAVWEFMWCIDKVTRVDEDGTGWVLGGKPIKNKDFKLGRHRNTTIRHLSTLKREGYIDVTRTPYGLVIKVKKAKKIFKQNREAPKMVHLKRSTKNGASLPKNGASNKTRQLDKTALDNAPAKTAAFSWKDYLEKMSNDKRRHIQIIGYFFEFKKIKFENEKEVSAAIKRHLRGAKELVGFHASKVNKAMQICQQEYSDVGWTLETCLKVLTK